VCARSVKAVGYVCSSCLDLNVRDQLCGREREKYFRKSFLSSDSCIRKNHRKYLMIISIKRYRKLIDLCVCVCVCVCVCYKPLAAIPSPRHLFGKLVTPLDSTPSMSHIHMHTHTRTYTHTHTHTHINHMQTPSFRRVSIAGDRTEYNFFFF